MLDVVGVGVVGRGEGIMLYGVKVIEMIMFVEGDGGEV